MLNGGVDRPLRCHNSRTNSHLRYGNRNVKDGKWHWYSSVGYDKIKVIKNYDGGILAWGIKCYDIVTWGELKYVQFRRGGILTPVSTVYEYLLLYLYGKRGHTKHSDKHPRYGLRAHG